MWLHLMPNKNKTIGAKDLFANKFHGDLVQSGLDSTYVQSLMGPLMTQKAYLCPYIRQGLRCCGDFTAICQQNSDASQDALKLFPDSPN